MISSYKVWENGSFNARRLVLRFVFGVKTIYARSEGVRTAPFSNPFQLIQGLKAGREYSSNLKSVMVGPEGWEPDAP